MDAAHEIPPDWLAEFEAAARRPLAQRFRYAFVRTHILGFPDTTQDAHIFPDRTPANGRAPAAALLELGFQLTDAESAEMERGKNFVQLKNGPFAGQGQGIARTAAQLPGLLAEATQALSPFPNLPQ
ncbi:MAG TPA: hypothetical protein VGV18_02125 [Verrucomicrobiae bacterium]|nr:hypothetical protein [Verrucomicrobiae bacterium]